MSGPPTRYILLLLLSSLAGITSIVAFDCYTGDDSTMRSKQCPSLGSMKLDVCFKRIGETPDDVQRGCFNSQIASFIVEDDQNASEGCTQIPEKYGSGTICLCQNPLCNSSWTLKGPQWVLSVSLMLLILPQLLGSS